jgi:hypothetical protein
MDGRLNSALGSGRQVVVTAYHSDIRIGISRCHGELWASTSIIKLNIQLDSGNQFITISHYFQFIDLFLRARFPLPFLAGLSPFSLVPGC